MLLLENMSCWFEVMDCNAAFILHAVPSVVDFQSSVLKPMYIIFSCSIFLEVQVVIVRDAVTFSVNGTWVMQRSL